MNTYIVIAVGGAFGAISRFWITTNVEKLYPATYPSGTFIVNLIGCFFIGLLFVLFSEKISLADDVRSLLVVGFLGAMTTFSTFSLDALLLIEQGQYGMAFSYLLGSVVVCLIATFIGINIARILF
ncbi:MAG: fluoride efflux transporter CrcB [Gammaproteobacteria bacterium]|nr:fluoride efflux transporter CrcB [Gammaproteobacteria bacterium]